MVHGVFHQTAGSRVGFGCMGMSGDFYGDADDAESLRVLHAAYDLGYRHFDTADFYGNGHNESLVGKFLAELGARRQEVLIATKCGIRRRATSGAPALVVDSSPDYIRAACEASLKRLGVERLGLLYLHRRDPATPIDATMEAMADLVASGKTVGVGLSEVSEATLRAAAAVHPIAALQSEYSLWSRDVETKQLAACEELGTNFVAYSPLGRGFLTGAVSAASIQHEKDLRRLLPRFSESNLPKNQALLAELEAIASEHSASMAAIALAWVLSRGEFVQVIPGTRSRERARANLDSRKLALTDNQRERLDRGFAPERIAGERLPSTLLSSVNT